MAAGCADYDGDGFVDIFLANYGPNRFYHNDGDGTFTDRTDELGLAGPEKLNGWVKWSVAVAPFDAWITGRKRYQGGKRAALDFFEDEGGTRIKINPLAHWGPADISEYMTNNRPPRHPLVARGYPSIGCAPCTTRVAPGEDPRAGRWRGQDKDECGIHFVNGKAVRTPLKEAS